jgi:hypothetical protein
MRIGIAILPPSEVRALRAVVEVLGLDPALLEEEDGKVIVPLSTRAHAKAPHTLVFDELVKH